MELLLNLCWLVVTAAAFGLWVARRRADVSAKAGRTLALEFLALAAAAILLFPLISLSDDLQAEPVLAEGRTLSQPTVKNWGNDRTRLTLCKAATPALAGILSFSFIAARVPGWTPVRDSLVTRSGFARSSDVRGPPLFRF